MNRIWALKGLYAITDPGLASDDDIVTQVELALQGGARAIQYRDKQPDQRQRVDEATALLRLCRTAGVPLIINDDLDLATAIQADGIHLGRDDPDPGEARAATRTRGQSSVYPATTGSSWLSRRRRQMPIMWRSGVSFLRPSNPRRFRRSSIC